MRLENQLLAQEYTNWLTSSAFFFVVDYRGLNVAHMTELRKRLRKVEATIHVVKNTLFKRALSQAGITDSVELTGQLAVILGTKDICATAKVVKNFASEFERPAIVFGYLGNQRLTDKQILQLADLPSLEELRAKLLGILVAPAAGLVRLLSTPATQLVRVLQAKIEKGS